MEKTRKPGMGLQATDGDALSDKRARAMGVDGQERLKAGAGQSMSPAIPQQHGRHKPSAPILLTDFLFHTTASL